MIASCFAVQDLGQANCICWPNGLQLEFGSQIIVEVFNLFSWYVTQIKWERKWADQMFRYIGLVFIKLFISNMEYRNYNRRAFRVILFFTTLYIQMKYRNLDRVQLTFIV